MTIMLLWFSHNAKSFNPSLNLGLYIVNLAWE
jgi:hypothetical protein